MPHNDQHTESTSTRCSGALTYPFPAHTPNSPGNQGSMQSRTWGRKLYSLPSWHLLFRRHRCSSPARMHALQERFHNCRGGCHFRKRMQCLHLQARCWRSCLRTVHVWVLLLRWQHLQSPATVCAMPQVWFHAQHWFNDSKRLCIPISASLSWWLHAGKVWSVCDLPIRSLLCWWYRLQVLPLPATDSDDRHGIWRYVGLQHSRWYAHPLGCGCCVVDSQEAALDSTASFVAKNYYNPSPTNRTCLQASRTAVSLGRLTTVTRRCHKYAGKTCWSCFQMQR